jgi:hemoglobin
MCVQFTILQTILLSVLLGISYLSNKINFFVFFCNLNTILHQKTSFFCLILTFNTFLMKNDILSSADVELLVKTFYTNLLKNEEVKPVFAHIDFEKHMPHMIAFWEFILLDKEGYSSNVFDKHVNLPLTENHFKIWLDVFETTVNLLFEGEKAKMAIQRAQTIGYTFEHKMKQMGKMK